MRVHQTSDGRRGDRSTRLGLMLVALAIATPARADEPAGRVPPIALAADRARDWEQDGAHYVLLEGFAAAFRGDEGLRAERILVRVSSRPNPEGGTTHDVEVYAEGNARRTGDDGEARRSRRESWSTTGQVTITASSGRAIETLPRPPAGLDLLARLSERKPEPPPARAAASNAPAHDEPADGAHGLPPLPEGPTADEAVKRASAEPEAPASPAEDDTRPVRIREPGYRRVQFIDGPGFPQLPGDPPPAPPGGPGAPPPADFGPALDPEPAAPAPAPRDRAGEPVPGQGPATELEPLPGVPANRAPAPRPDGDEAPSAPVAPIAPGSRRITTIYGGPNFQPRQFQASDGTRITVVTGGVNIITNDPKLGTVDVEADSAIIWNKPKPDSPPVRLGPNQELVQSKDDPMEVYLEGHVIFRQDRRKLQGTDDQVVYRAKRAYYDYMADRFIGLDAEVNVFSPGLVAPLKINTPRMDQFHPLVTAPDGRTVPQAFEEIRVQESVSTGSRFAIPGYRFASRSLDLKKVLSDNVPLERGGDSPTNEQRTTWRIDARQNVFYAGPIPTFYWPRFVSDADDLDPPLRMFSYRTNNYFGSMFLFDFTGFKLFNIRKPSWIDIWNVDVDYLTARGPALGTELGWFGIDPIRDLTDPYHRNRDWSPGTLRDYMGYLDMWGIYDHNVDDLGTGPAVITFPNNYGKFVNGQLIPYPTRQNDPVSLHTDNLRGRLNARHFQWVRLGDEEEYDDTRFSLEAGYLSDRNFLQQYFPRLFFTGLDHEDLFYGYMSRRNQALTLQTELNPNPWNTESQWLPKLDHYRLGERFLGDLAGDSTAFRGLTYFGHTGVDYASVHTANDVNNPNTLFYMPYDPVSNTSRQFNSARFYTAQEIDAPINLGALRVVPYAQGQLVGWTDQINGEAVGRAWGAAGARADVMAWKAYPDADSELMNVHGLNHKLDFMADYRDAWSNVNLNTLGVQDDLDDNTYEMGRRYFAMMNYAGGLLPYQYDPRYLLLRRTASPITQTTDLQASIDTLRLGIHQRLQTKRGPEGRRRIIDYVVLDVDSTYFPNASRDNFGSTWGQNQYNFEWYIGDRTAITSYGWFEFWNVGGVPLNKVINKNKLNPNGLNVITAGITVNRPPRGMVYFGYTVIDTGLIQSSALSSSYTYWMSPKWYTTFSAQYDFANNVLLNSTAAITRIGRDFMTTVGLNVSPLQHSFMFGFEVTPRISPSVGLGSGAISRLDTRYAPKD